MIGSYVAVGVIYLPYLWKSYFLICMDHCVKKIEYRRWYANNIRCGEIASLYNEKYKDSVFTCGNSLHKKKMVQWKQCAHYLKTNIIYIICILVFLNFCTYYISCINIGIIMHRSYQKTIWTEEDMFNCVDQKNIKNYNKGFIHVNKWHN